MIAEYAGTTNHAGLSMGVFFSFCFITFYGGGIDVVSTPGGMCLDTRCYSFSHSPLQVCKANIDRSAMSIAVSTIQSFSYLPCTHATPWQQKCRVTV